jgi:hypothetical protein
MRKPMLVTETALLVPLFVPHAVFGAFREKLDPAAKRGIPAHVTVLYPFVPPDRTHKALFDELRSLFAAFAAFDVSLARTAWFGESVLWLAPEPATPFRKLTDAVATRWPEHLPYGGRFAEIIPHLTIGDGAPREALREAEHEIAPALPMAARASEVILMSGSSEPRSWRTLARFPLGEFN